MGRGRPAILKDRKTTTVSIEGRQFEFILKKGIDLSKLVRDTIDVLMQEEETPIEELKRQKEELEKEKLDREIQINQLERMIKEAEEVQQKEEEDGRILNEFEEKRREYVKGCIKSMQTQTTCNRMWLEYLLEAWKFTDFTEAKEYVKNVWIDEGVPEKRVKNYLRLN